MEYLDDFISMIDAMLDSKRKRHITVVTIKNEEDYDE